MGKVKAPSGEKAPAKVASASIPPVWYFPSPDPDYVIACKYNAVQKVYNVDCRPVRKSEMSKNVKSAFVRVSNAIANTALEA